MEVVLAVALLTFSPNNPDQYWTELAMSDTAMATLRTGSLQVGCGEGMMKNL